MFMFNVRRFNKYSQLLDSKETVKNILRKRQLSTVTQINARIKHPSFYKTTTEDCMPTFYNLVTELSNRKSEEPKEFSNHINNILLYNVPRGKKVRVRTLVTAYKILTSAEDLTNENLQLAYILGWCIEMLNSFILIDDDIMDASTQRRGAPCWYLVKGVGLRAISDGMTLENAVYEVLKKYFSCHSCYKDTMELFQKALYMTCLGQSLDTLRPKDEKLSITNFYTHERYSALVKYKTHYYTLELPIALALILSGKYDKNHYEQINPILMELSYFFQAQNDFRDCFSDSSTTGKEGTDIQEGKCTWLIVTALEKGTPSQRKILDENYGKSNYENIRNVLNVYEELNLPKLYYDYKDNINNIISPQINKISHVFPEMLFTFITDIVCRSKFKN